MPVLCICLPQGGSKILLWVGRFDRHGFVGFFGGFFMPHILDFEVEDKGLRCLFTTFILFL